ncbi:uncharacterized protein DEA37_0002152 [Paragonimus westermani]|uniref:Kelch domain-containing protein 10 n=1 Tax=Paragonimus westermani TaxID=34504 RepID=A0A5J4NNN4_9TREM|nr:uncharacterized protein DEA37_0002152 [Paragonimus westermani]
MLNTLKQHTFKLGGVADAPLPRSGHCLVGDESNVYVIGGYVQYSNELRVKGEIWRFNFLSESWRKIQFSQSTFHLAASHAVCLTEHIVVIHGGTGTQFGKYIDNSLTVLNLKTRECHMLPVSCKDGIRHHLPLPTYGHTLTHVVLNNESYLYKVGGVMATTYIMNVYRYSMREKTWERISHENDSNDWRPAPRYRHDTVLFNDKLHIVAGGNADVTHPLWPMPVLDLRTHKWSKIIFSGNKPGLFRYQSSTLVGDSVFVIGGITDDQAISDGVFCLDLQNRICTKIGTQKLPAYFHYVTYIPQFHEIYSFGGNVSVQPVQRTNTLHRFRVLHYPSLLAELAWNALVSLVTNKSSFITLVRKWLVMHVKREDLPAASCNRYILQEIRGHLEDIQSAVLKQYRMHVPAFYDGTIEANPMFTSPFRSDSTHLLGAALQATAVTLLVHHGVSLGLYDIPAVSTNSPVSRDSLVEWICGSALEFENWVKCIEAIRQLTLYDRKGDSQGVVSVHASGPFSRLHEHFEFDDESVIDQYSMRAQLHLEGSLDELFMTSFFYNMHIPEKFICRLPEGPLYLKFVRLLETAVLQRTAPRPA